MNRKRVGICGIGQIGAAAAVAFQRAGHHVLLWSRNEEKLRATEPRLREMAASSETGCGPPPQSGGSIQAEPEWRRLDQEADVILECIIEVMEEKVELLQMFANARERACLFLSSTSGLSITEMSRRSGLESLLVGAHFWNPPHLIPVVEMIRGANTPQERFQEACALMEDIGKRPVPCADVPGFIGNRLMIAMWREALALVDAGVCSAEDIDLVVKLTFALRLPALGPMENMDYVGLDAAERIQRYLLPDLARNDTPSGCLVEKVKAGHLGMKSGQGFHDWSKRDAGRLLALRDAQIVRQLQFLKEQGVLP
jgi:3-hydroxybutyryl-CoA dehydrogenase